MAIVGTLGTNILIHALSAISGVWIARMLGPEGRGEFAVALFWPALFASLGVVGTDVSLARLASHYPNSLELRRKAIKIMLILGSATILICWISLPKLLSEKQINLLPLSFLLMLSIPGAMANLLLFSMELGRGHHRNYNLARLAFSIAYLVTLLVVTVRGKVNPSTVGIAFVSATVLSAFFTFILTGWSATRREGGEARAISATRLVREGLPFGLLTLITSTNTQLPMLILMALTEVRAVGIFIVAYNVSAIHQAAAGAVGKVLFGVSARGDANRDKEWWLRTCRLMVGLYLFLTIIMVGPLLVLIPVVFGDEFKEIVIMMPFLLPATALIALAEIYDEILKGRGIWKAGLIGRIAGALVLISVAIFIVPELQGLGMVVAIVLSAIMQFVVLLIMIAHEFTASWSAVMILTPKELALAFQSFNARKYDVKIGLKGLMEKCNIN